MEYHTLKNIYIDKTTNMGHSWQGLLVFCGRSSTPVSSTNKTILRDIVVCLFDVG